MTSANKSLEKKIFLWVENVIKQLVHMSAVRSLRYEALGKFWRALKKLELLLATPQATLAHLSCSANFLHASYLNERKLTYEPIMKLHYCLKVLEIVTYSLNSSL